MPFVQRLRNITLVIAAVSIGFTSSPTAAHADTTVANWGQQSPAQAPAGRAYAAMAYDSLRGRTVFLGGDTWEWDGGHWTTFLTTVSPPPSIDPGMLCATDRHKLVCLVNVGT